MAGSLWISSARTGALLGMRNADELVGNESTTTAVLLCEENDIYLVYLPSGGTATLNMSKAGGLFTVDWFDPDTGES
jgi:hypothetical protein